MVSMECPNQLHCPLLVYAKSEKSQDVRSKVLFLDKNCSLKLFLIAETPFVHGVDDRAHRFAQLTEGVFDPGRNLRIDRADDKAVGFQGTETVGQDFLADTVQVFAQFVEPPRPGQQVPQDEQLPFVADERNSGRQRKDRRFLRRRPTVLEGGRLK